MIITLTLKLTLTLTPILAMIKTLDDWFFHIKQIHHQRIELGLDRVSVVADRLHLRHFSCPVITVAGTNGKGSTVKTLESIYSHAGYKTALYTSPHLMEFNERIRIHDQNVCDADLLRAFEAIEQARADIILSFFEFTTLAALYLFHQAACDVAILEVGLGGRLDAVNCVESDVAIVTTIALDHMEWLGDSRESIAYEKSCIARSGKPFICGEENPPHTLQETAVEKNASLYQVNRDFFYQVDATSMAYHDKYRRYDILPLPQLKPQNIATAIAAIHCLLEKLPVNHQAIVDGISHTQWPGRFERHASPFPCILDVAHNPQSAEWFALQCAQLTPVQHTIAVVGMLKDKAITETISPLLPHVNTWYVCSLLSDSKERGSDGSAIVDYLSEMNQKNYKSFATVGDALYSVVQAYCKQQCDRVLIFGSFYTVAAAKEWLANQEKQGERLWKRKPNSD